MAKRVALRATTDPKISLRSQAGATAPGAKLTKPRVRTQIDHAALNHTREASAARGE